MLSQKFRILQKFKPPDEFQNRVHLESGPWVLLLVLVTYSTYPVDQKPTLQR